MQANPSVAYGYCQCGCGQKTNLTPLNNATLGYVRGEPKQFLSGHNNLRQGPEYVVTDCGYETPCWIFTMKTQTRGYGRRKVGGLTQSIHRVYYQRYKGAIPEGWHVHHKCRQRGCMNPAHLEAVSPVEHIRIERAVLRREDIVTIKRSLAQFSGYGACTALARQFGVNAATINDIKHGRTWGDVS